MKNLVWLASYPKSGNTWLRLLLANYLAGGSSAVPIDKVEQYSTGDSVLRHYAAVSKNPKFDPTDDAAVLRFRDVVFRTLSANGANVNLIKTHNKNKRLNSVRLIPPLMTRHAFYIVRNPLDMLVSYADHYGLAVEDAAVDIANPATCILPNNRTVRQFTGNWSEHVLSWTKNPKFPVTVLRYEDMIEDDEKAFSTVMEALGAPVDTARLKSAVEYSRFSNLRKQEDVGGFVERSPASKRFFRAGKTGEGRSKLPTEVIDKVIRDHHAVMESFGYLK